MYTFFQLDFKQKEMRKIINSLGEQISKVNRDVGDWLNEQKNKYDGLPCELGKIVHTDVINGYRNKCEFTIGETMNNNKLNVLLTICNILCMC